LEKRELVRKEKAAVSSAEENKALVHLQDRFRVTGYSKRHENSNLCTFVL
jgi:hypothetical protein